MKHLFSVLLFSISLIFCNLNTIAQIDSFNLELYKLPQLERHQLDLKFSTGGGGNYDDFKNLYFPYERNTINASNLNFSSNLETRYQGYYNSRDYQGNQNASLNISGVYNNGKNQESGITTNSNYNKWGFAFSGNSNNRFYFNNLFFIESNFYLSNLNFSIYNQTSTPDTTSNKSIHTNERKNVEVSIPLKVGKGRVEPLQDARMAVYIIDQLSKRGKLKQQPSRDEILAFAREIAEIKNERFFDTRNRRVYELTRLDSFLNKHNFLDKTDIEYFTTMNDYWRYANNPQRGAGSRFSFGIEPWYNYFRKYERDKNLSSQIDKINYRNRYYGVRGLLEYDYEKPHNLYWHSSFQGGLSYGYEIYEHNDNQAVSKIKHNRQALNASFQYTLGWFPDSRSYYRYYIQGYYYRFFQEENEFENLNDYKAWGEKTDYFFRTGLSGYYYFSPRLRFSGGFSLYHRNINIPAPEMNYTAGMLHLKEGDWNFNIHLSIEYSFF